MANARTQEQETEGAASHVNTKAARPLYTRSNITSRPEKETPPPQETEERKLEASTPTRTHLD